MHLNKALILKVILQLQPCSFRWGLHCQNSLRICKLPLHFCIHVIDLICISVSHIVASAHLLFTILNVLETPPYIDNQKCAFKLKANPFLAYNLYLVLCVSNSVWFENIHIQLFSQFSTGTFTYGFRDSHAQKIEGIKYFLSILQCIYVNC